MSVLKTIAPAILVMAVSVQGSSASEVEEMRILGALAPVRGEIGKSISSVNSLDYGNVSDVLSYSPGITVKRINGLSGNTSVRIRGQRSIDTKLLWNGYDLGDPSDPQGSANPIWGDLATGSTSSLEILRGPSSSLYGSEAIGGVVNVSPSKDSKKVYYEYGSFNTHTTGFNIMGLSGEQTASDGFDHHDDYQRIALSGVHNLGDIELTWLYQDVDAFLNQPPVVGREDVDDENDTREYRIGLIGIDIPITISDNLQVTVKPSYSVHNRRFTFNPNSDGTGFLSDGNFQGRTFNLRTQVLWDQGWATTVLGHQYTREFLKQRSFTADSKTETDQYSNDFYLEEIIYYGDTTISLEARQNTHETAKGRATWNASVSHMLTPEITARSHYGTSFREPSLFELDGSFLSSFGRTPVGNSGLSPERAKGFDIGLDYKGPISISTAFFRHDLNNKIDFIGGRYENVQGQDHTRGFESEVSFGPARFTHTYIGGSELFDIPAHTFTGSIQESFGNFRGGLRAIYKGSRTARVFNNSTFSLDSIPEDSYVTVDAYLGYNVREGVTLYVRAENLLSENYTEGGFRTPGATVFGGVTWSV